MKIIFLVILAWLNTLVFAADFELKGTIHNGKSVPFLGHSGLGAWDNYLIMNLPFEPMADLFKQLLIKERKQLTNRGEAHITVITPVEYWNVLRPQGVTMQEINDIAESFDIQNSTFTILCLGRGQATIDNKREETFFVVVKSSDLVAIRKRIQDLLISKGGSKSQFRPNNFYPHITLGFTKRDLHESDGIIKGESSCFYTISEIP